MDNQSSIFEFYPISHSSTAVVIVKLRTKKKLLAPLFFAPLHIPSAPIVASSSIKLYVDYIITRRWYSVLSLSWVSTIDHNENNDCSSIIKAIGVHAILASEILQ